MTADVADTVGAFVLFGGLILAASAAQRPVPRRVVLTQAAPRAGRQVVPQSVSALAAVFALICVALLFLVPFGLGEIAVPDSLWSSLGLGTPNRGFVAAFIFLLAGMGLMFFGVVVVYILFLSIDDAAFDADAVRLARDTLISVGFNISAGALLYKYYGISPPDWDPEIAPGDYLYVSAVTFSTLGYGDYAPLRAARPVAAFYAILGNLHLGIIVGAVLVALKGRPGP